MATNKSVAPLFIRGTDEAGEGRPELAIARLYDLNIMQQDCVLLNKVLNVQVSDTTKA